jgi:hypothetical protein
MMSGGIGLKLEDGGTLVIGDIIGLRVIPRGGALVED